MKKQFAILSILLSTMSYSYKVLTQDRGIIDKLFTANQLKNEVSNRYDYKNDIAVISDGYSSREKAGGDAIKGLEKTIYNYAYNVLSVYLEKANLTGPGFNEYILKQFANEIAVEKIEKEKYIIEGTWEDKNNGNYYVLVKIDRDVVERDAKIYFKDRLEKVIDHLEEVKEGIKID